MHKTVGIGRMMVWGPFSQQGIPLGSGIQIWLRACLCGFSKCSIDRKQGPVSPASLVLLLSALSPCAPPLLSVSPCPPVLLASANHCWVGTVRSVTAGSEVWSAVWEGQPPEDDSLPFYYIVLLCSDTICLGEDVFKCAVGFFFFF